MPNRLPALLLLAAACSPCRLLAQDRAPAPDWTLNSPARPPATARLPAQEARRNLAETRQPLAAAVPVETFAVTEMAAPAIPDGYRGLTSPPPSPLAMPDDRQRAPSQLPEDSLPESRQLALLRQRVAALTRQMDELLARLAASEQALASHRHSYSVPNMGLVSVETYQSYLDRQQRSGKPVAYFSGSVDTRTTSAAAVPR
ncbi:MAG: hypothetical protein NTW01_15535 [Gammaproteobacteria bacterium]|uniref:hypothetical protein n=1 Tax=Nevskia sp. TaxID=1929292 RepID=UPI004035F90A|nr:hypothetical protein [Gammaproteobacteria bacterium]